MKPALILSLALGLLPALAGAQQVAYTAKQVNLRAGPDRMYPVVAILPSNAQVVVQGCVPDYRWCDIAFGAVRGWVYSGNIRYPYQNGYAPLLSVGPLVGLTVFGFVLGDYWGEHYRDRPFYRDRDRWVHPPPRFAPPRPRPPIHVQPPPPPRPRAEPHPPRRVEPNPRPRPERRPEHAPRSNSGWDPAHPITPRDPP